MATTTIFGVTIPDDTDLVKDGAAAIRTVGNGFDGALGKVAFNAKTDTYTAVLADNKNTVVTMDKSTANDFLIPTNANVAFPIGSVINVVQIGSGQTTIKAVASGTTTINSTGATATAPTLRVRFSAASCIKTSTDVWLVVGDIA
jgi:ABC-type taurine transport system substrate-binding protein